MMRTFTFAIFRLLALSATASVLCTRRVLLVVEANHRASFVTFAFFEKVTNDLLSAHLGVV